MANKIKSLKELTLVLAQHRRRQEKVVFTNGCFDLLHLGHLSYLQKAKSLGNRLVVAVNSDSSVRKIKPRPRPITPERERAGLIAGFECVDYVTIFKDATPLNLIKILKPDILVKGADWKKQDIAGKNIVEAYGGKIIQIRFLKNHSTSLIIRRIRQGK